MKVATSVERPRDALQEWIEEHLRELDREREVELAAREVKEEMGELAPDGMRMLEESS